MPYKLTNEAKMDLARITGVVWKSLGSYKLTVTMRP